MNYNPLSPEVQNNPYPYYAELRGCLKRSSNRDERKYADPDRFDVLRNPRDHLDFGYGIHYCLGAQLARVEAKVALDALLFEQPPFVKTNEKMTRGDGLAVRGPQTLQLRFAA